MKPSYFRLQFISGFLGNLFENYDMALYSLLTPFFASIFFSESDHLSALILTYAIIPLGMIARPIGALVFGYIGDHYGRRQALFISLLGLGVISGLFAFAPTYQQAGFLAPILLLIGRMMQNFFGIGEYLGGAIYLLEHTSEKKQDLISSLYGSSTVAGYLLASLGVSLFCFYGTVNECWRILYLIGSLTALFGSIFRKKMADENVNEKQSAMNRKEMVQTLWQYRQIILLIALVAGFSHATCSIALGFFNGFIPLISNVTKEQMVNLNTLLLIFDCFTLPIFGLMANRFSRKRMMILSAICTVVSGIPLFVQLEMASMPMIVAVRTIIVVFGVWFAAPFHSWAQQLVPAAHRYSVISFGYAIGSQLFGGPAAVISLWFFQQTHLVWTASCYWIVLAFATGVCLRFSQQKEEAAASNSSYAK